MDTSAQAEVLLARLGNLADPTRLRLLRLLEVQELGVAELCDVLQLPQSTVSRHLKVLSDQRWLRSRSHRTTNLYQMADDELDAAARELWLLAREQSDSWATARQDNLRLARRLEQRGAEEFFASAAGDWDRMRTELFGSRLTQRAQLAMLPPEWTVADLGCGTGTALLELAPHVRRVIGVDQSEAMLESARRRTAGLDNVELHQADLASPPLSPASCDAAQIVLALGYVAEPEHVLAAMARALKPGARGVVIDLLRHDRDDFRRRMGQNSLGFERDGLAASMAVAGFETLRVQVLPPEPEASGPALLLVSGQRAAD